MEWRNKNTGVVIDIPSPVVSPDWEPVQKPKAEENGRSEAKSGKPKEVPDGNRKTGI